MAIEVMEMKIRRASDIERAMKRVEASMNVDGFFSTEEQDELIRKKLRGDITQEEFVKRALELAKK